MRLLATEVIIEPKTPETPTEPKRSANLYDVLSSLPDLDRLELEPIELGWTPLCYHGFLRSGVEKDSPVLIYGSKKGPLLSMKEERLDETVPDQSGQGHPDQMSGQLHRCAVCLEGPGIWHCIGVVADASHHAQHG